MSYGTLNYLLLEASESLMLRQNDKNNPRLKNFVSHNMLCINSEHTLL